MKNYHATVHDPKTDKIIFEAQVYAENAGSAHDKIAKYLVSIGKPEIAALGAILMEIGDRHMTGVPVIQ